MLAAFIGRRQQFEGQQFLCVGGGYYIYRYGLTFVTVDDEVAKEVKMDHMHSTDMHSTDMSSMDMDTHSMNSTCSFSSDVMHGGMMQVSMQPFNVTLMR